MSKSLDGAYCRNDSEDPPSTISSITGTNWERLDNITFANRTYFDLSGYNMDDLSVFFQSVDIQEEFGIYGLLQSWVIDIISTEYISDLDIINAHINNALSPDDLPGFPKSTFNQEQIIYARNRTYVTSTIWGGIGIFDTTMWGTGAASTVDKLHVTRIIYTDVNVPPTQAIFLPPCTYVVGIIVAKEKELTYLMRQKRSYELATGP